MKKAKLSAILLYCAINLDIYPAAQISSDLSLNKKKLESVFLTAAYNNNTEIMESSISQGVNINCRDNLGKTALIYAVSNSNKEMVQRLITLKADVNIPDNDELTALIWVSTYPCNKNKFDTLRVEIAQLLINAGADVNFSGKCRETALYYAIHDPNIVDLLIKNRADVNASNANGVYGNAMHRAILFRELNSINLMVKAGANLKDALSSAIIITLSFGNASSEYLKKEISKDMKIIRLLIANGGCITTKEIDEYIARNYPSLTDFQKTRLVIIYNLLDRTSRFSDPLMDTILDYL